MPVVYDGEQQYPASEKAKYDIVKRVPPGYVLYNVNGNKRTYYAGEKTTKNGIALNPESGWQLLEIGEFLQTYGHLITEDDAKRIANAYDKELLRQYLPQREPEEKPLEELPKEEQKEVPEQEEPTKPTAKEEKEEEKKVELEKILEEEEVSDDERFIYFLREKGVKSFPELLNQYGLEILDELLTLFSPEFLRKQYLPLIDTAIEGLEHYILTNQLSQEDIDKLLGQIEDFNNLFEELYEKGLKKILSPDDLNRILQKTSDLLFLGEFLSDALKQLPEGKTSKDIVPSTIEETLLKEVEKRELEPPPPPPALEEPDYTKDKQDEYLQRLKDLAESEKSFVSTLDKIFLATLGKRFSNFLDAPIRTFFYKSKIASEIDRIWRLPTTLEQQLFEATYMLYGLQHGVDILDKNYQEALWHMANKDPEELSQEIEDLYKSMCIEYNQATLNSASSTQSSIRPGDSFRPKKIRETDFSEECSAFAQAASKLFLESLETILQELRTPKSSCAKCITASPLRFDYFIKNLREAGINLDLLSAKTRATTRSRINELAEELIKIQEETSYEPETEFEGEFEGEEFKAEKISWDFSEEIEEEIDHEVENKILEKLKSEFGKDYTSVQEAVADIFKGEADRVVDFSRLGAEVPELQEADRHGKLFTLVSLFSALRPKISQENNTSAFGLLDINSSEKDNVFPEYLFYLHTNFAKALAKEIGLFVSTIRELKTKDDVLKAIRQFYEQKKTVIEPILHALNPEKQKVQALSFLTDRLEQTLEHLLGYGTFSEVATEVAEQQSLKPIYNRLRETYPDEYGEYSDDQLFIEFFAELKHDLVSEINRTISSISSYVFSSPNFSNAPFSQEERFVVASNKETVPDLNDIQAIYENYAKLESLLRIYNNLFVNLPIDEEGGDASKFNSTQTAFTSRLLFLLKLMHDVETQFDKIQEHEFLGQYSPRDKTLTGIMSVLSTKSEEEISKGIQAIKELFPMLDDEILEQFISADPKNNAPLRTLQLYFEYLRNLVPEGENKDEAVVSWLYDILTKSSSYDNVLYTLGFINELVQDEENLPYDTKIFNKFVGKVKKLLKNVATDKSFSAYASSTNIPKEALLPKFLYEKLMSEIRGQTEEWPFEEEPEEATKKEQTEETEPTSAEEQKEETEPTTTEETTTEETSTEEQKPKKKTPKKKSKKKKTEPDTASEVVTPEVTEETVKDVFSDVLGTPEEELKKELSNLDAPSSEAENLITDTETIETEEPLNETAEEIPQDKEIEKYHDLFDRVPLYYSSIRDKLMNILPTFDVENEEILKNEIPRFLAFGIADLGALDEVKKDLGTVTITGSHIMKNLFQELPEESQQDFNDYFSEYEAFYRENKDDVKELLSLLQQTPNQLTISEIIKKLDTIKDKGPIGQVISQRLKTLLNANQHTGLLIKKILSNDDAMAIYKSFEEDIQGLLFEDEGRMLTLEEGDNNSLELAFYADPVYSRIPAYFNAEDAKKDPAFPSKAALIGYVMRKELTNEDFLKRLGIFVDRVNEAITSEDTEEQINFNLTLPGGEIFNVKLYKGAEVPYFIVDDNISGIKIYKNFIDVLTELSTKLAKKYISEEAEPIQETTQTSQEQKPKKQSKKKSSKKKKEEAKVEEKQETIPEAVLKTRRLENFAKKLKSDLGIDIPISTADNYDVLTSLYAKHLVSENSENSIYYDYKFEGDKNQVLAIHFYEDRNSKPRVILAPEILAFFRGEEPELPEDFIPLQSKDPKEVYLQSLAKNLFPKLIYAIEDLEEDELVNLYNALKEELASLDVEQYRYKNTQTLTPKFFKDLTSKVKRVLEETLQIGFAERAIAEEVLYSFFHIE